MKALFLDLDNTIFDSKQAYDYALSRLAARFGGYFRGINFLEEFEIHKKEVKTQLKGHPGNKNRLLVLKRMADIYWEGLDAEKLLFLEKNYFKFFKKNISEQLRNNRKGYKKLFSLIEQFTAKYPVYILTNESLRTQLYKISWVFPPNLRVKLLSSEEVGHEKPSQEFYSYALKKAGVDSNNTVMVGDSMEDDVLGGLASNLKTFHLTEIFGEESITEETIGVKKYYQAKNLPFVLEKIFEEFQNK
ncbi:MAG: HAD family hydrolase [Leptospiraceae bacterium]|nr:HAD family hydrolase [Leptospiraceae bacterium]